MAGVRIATPTGNIPEASEVQTPLYSGHFKWHQWSLHYGDSTVLQVEVVNFNLYSCNIAKRDCTISIHSQQTVLGLEFGS